MVIGCIALLQQSCSRLFTTWFSDVLSRSLVDNNMRVALEVVWELEAGGLPYSLLSGGLPLLQSSSISIIPLIFRFSSPPIPSNKAARFRQTTKSHNVSQADYQN